MNIRVYDGITPELTRIASQLKRSRGLMVVLGAELREGLRQHWYNRGAFYQTKIARYLGPVQADDRSASVTVGAEGGPILQHKIDGGTVRPIPPKKRLAISANTEAKKLGWPSHWSKPGDGQLETVWGKNGPYALALVGIRDKSLRKRIGITDALRQRKAAHSKYMRSAMAGIRDAKVRGRARAAMVAKAKADAVKASKRGSGAPTAWRGRIMYWLAKSATHRPDPQALPPQYEMELRLLAAGEKYLQETLDGQMSGNSAAG